MKRCSRTDHDWMHKSGVPAPAIRRIYERSGLARIEEAYAKLPRETVTRARALRHSRHTAPRAEHPMQAIKHQPVAQAERSLAMGFDEEIGDLLPRPRPRVRNALPSQNSFPSMAGALQDLSVQRRRLGLSAFRTEPRSPLGALFFKSYTKQTLEFIFKVGLTRSPHITTHILQSIKPIINHVILDRIKLFCGEAHLREKIQIHKQFDL